MPRVSFADGFVVNIGALSPLPPRSHLKFLSRGRLCDVWGHRLIWRLSYSSDMVYFLSSFIWCTSVGNAMLLCFRWFWNKEFSTLFAPGAVLPGLLLALPRLLVLMGVHFNRNISAWVNAWKVAWYFMKQSQSILDIFLRVRNLKSKRQ